MFDWTISLGNLLTLGMAAVTIIVLITTMRQQIAGLATEVGGMKTEMKQLVIVLVNQGRMDERMDGIDNRVNNQAQSITDLYAKFDRLQERQYSDKS